jgi:tetratricopeptide (TPR) repeat protein
MGRPEEGAAFAMRAVALAPGDVRALCTLAWLQGACEQHGEQLRSAERAIAADPESEWAQRLRGSALWKLGRHQSAADAMGEAIRLAPTEPRALWSFAWYASLVGRGEEAMTVAQRAVELYPEDPQCWFGLGWAAWSVQNWQVAEDALTRARALAPDNSLWHNNLGTLYVKRGKIGEGLACFERALELDPRSVYAYRNAAYCLRRLDRWDEAASLDERDQLNKLHAADKALASSASSAAYASRALALANLERYREAEGDLELALELARSADESARPLRVLATIKLVLGDDRSACRLANRAVDEFSGDLLSVSTASWVGWLAGDADLAERAAAAAVAYELAPITVAECTGFAALARSDWTGAERPLLEQLDLSRTMVNCCTYAALGVVYEELGRAEDAESSFFEARRGNPRCESLTVLRNQARI